MSRHRHRLICVDETSTSTNMTRARGRCLKGERLMMKNPFGHWKTETMIAGLKCDGLIAPFIIPEPMNRVIFEAWVEQMLVPQLHPGDVVIMDNLPAHKSLVAEAAIRSAGAWLVRRANDSLDHLPSHLTPATLQPGPEPHRNGVLKTQSTPQGNLCQDHP